MGFQCPTPGQSEQGRGFGIREDLFLGSLATLFKHQEQRMRDFIFAICTIGFFVASILYLRACERLK
jgi:hypothetical protein